MGNKKKDLFLVGLFALLLVACTASTAIAPTPSPFPRTSTFTPAFTPTASPSLPTSTASPSFTHTASPTKRPTLTPSAIPSATPSPTLTATFDERSIVTRTPASPARCPLDSQDAAIPNPNELPEDQQEFEKTILAVLNAGGTKRLVEKFAGSYSAQGLAYQDLTGDGMPELIIVSRYFWGNLYVFGCYEQQYKTLLVEKVAYEQAPTIVAINDMNLDGVNDLAIEQSICNNGCTGARVYEWDGQQFQSLVRDWGIHPDVFHGIHPDINLLDYSDMAQLLSHSSASVTDIDDNGTHELVLAGGTPSYLGALTGGEGPWREQTIVYMWDGHYFVWHSQKYIPPVFRFEAIQDGDTASVRGDYEAALASYQDAIFSDTLKSWSREVWDQLVQQTIEQEQRVGYPDVSTMPFNPTEYAQLAAYARYRIMLLHIVRGGESDARTVHETLIKKFPEGSQGYPYVEMATRFWMEYQSSHNVEQACERAVAYAQAHQEMLAPLGGGDHGSWNEFYKPASVCPFK